MATITERRGTALSQLKEMLRERNEHPERKTQIDEEIKQTFEREVAILVLDMCGFSRTTMKFGIIHFLSMIAQMETLAHPAVAANGGLCIKQDADNLFVTFPTPAQAVEAALDILRAFRAADMLLPDDREIYGSIGIGYGSTLVIGDEDLFGNEMNLASKLGEDLADSMEILLTESAATALADSSYRLEPITFNISGLEFNSFKLQHRV